MASNEKASESQFNSLHELTARTLLEEIERYRSGQVRHPETGEPLPVPPALLAQAIKLLKDNGIDSPRREGNAIDRLASRLPQLSSLGPDGLPN